MKESIISTVEFLKNNSDSNRENVIENYKKSIYLRNQIKNVEVKTDLVKLSITDENYEPIKKDDISLIKNLYINNNEKYKLIVEYLARNNINNIKQLKMYNFDNLFAINGVTMKHIENFKELVENQANIFEVKKPDLSIVQKEKEKWQSNYFSIESFHLKQVIKNLKETPIRIVFPANTKYNRRIINRLVKRNVNNIFEIISLDLNKLNQNKIFKVDIKGIEKTIINYIFGIDKKIEAEKNIKERFASAENTKNEKTRSRQIMNEKISENKHVQKDHSNILAYKDEKDKVLQSLRQIVENEMSLGYASIENIYEQAIFNPSLNTYINDNKITKSNDLLPLIKEVNSNILSAGGKFIYDKRQNIQSMEDYIFSLEKQTIYLEEISVIIKEYQFRDSHLPILINRLIESGKYFKISENKYQKSQTFYVEEETRYKIVEMMKEICLDKGFIVLKKVEDSVRLKFGITDNVWNQYTLSYLLERNGFKKLERYNEHAAIETIVMVLSEFQGNTIDVLVHKLIKEVYTGNFHEAYIYDFLSDIGIYDEVEHFSSKCLKADLKNGGLIKVDIARRVSVI